MFSCFLEEAVDLVINFLPLDTSTKQTGLRLGWISFFIASPVSAEIEGGGLRRIHAACYVQHNKSLSLIPDGQTGKAVNESTTRQNGANRAGGGSRER